MYARTCVELVGCLVLHLNSHLFSKPLIGLLGCVVLFLVFGRMGVRAWVTHLRDLSSTRMIQSVCRASDGSFLYLLLAKFSRGRGGGEYVGKSKSLIRPTFFVALVFCPLFVGKVCRLLLCTPYSIINVQWSER